MNNAPLICIKNAESIGCPPFVYFVLVITIGVQKGLAILVPGILSMTH
jgi:hypothetical protein